MLKFKYVKSGINNIGGLIFKFMKLLSYVRQINR